ncbi:Hpt domain-containing protein [Polaribacter vadi]|uniref:Hpt domain-containing protein n=1 Tax=Polaribacter TaxID=52959 RepID=UPI001C0A3458|nr:MULTISPECIES: Hpt domain-containing protein [Polaribacter]MBU3011552.1 Hpt domain-containing protein [Polaribacter vadi]MDO6741365.1 Hpt domain-containing protein [Polaribacter sp. 1_MG-2023]
MELPNLSVIKEISGDDIEFQNSILGIIKEEFTEEVNLFKQNFKAKKYIETSNNVHKLKHKISLLGLKKGLKTATEYEIALKKDNIELHHNFLEILDKIHVYLYD